MGDFDEEDVEEDEEELMEEEQLVVKEGRKNLDGGRGRVGVESAVAPVHSLGGVAATLFLPTFLFTAGASAQIC